MLNNVSVKEIVFFCSFSIGLSGCASVPSEVVELSYTVGQDIREIEQSYDALITFKFDAMRQDRLNYLDNEWVPAYLDEFVEEGRLVDIAQGDIVWSESDEMFVNPTPGLEQRQLLDTVLVWSRTAIEEIEGKRAELIGPLDDQERLVRAEAAAAFDQIRSANAHVTAHLNSLKKVRDVQNQALDLLDSRGRVADLNERIIGISEWAEESLEEIRKADERL
ncbi:hypothetical protein [Saccharospirillum impatiens]|uniref:hypothetical protein n=1 Tax=Saccharospirillum impatiens TaxID=169438 RepID=UPI0003FF2B90|nr:hypothetical protein [Saccharospirillum impatiens]